MNYWDKAFHHAYIKMIFHPNTTYSQIAAAFTNWLERGLINQAQFAILLRFAMLIKTTANPLPYERSSMLQAALNERKEG